MAAQSPDVEYELVGSHTRYSSWTARIETLLHYYSISYTPITLNVVEKSGIAKAYSPRGMVPTLIVTSKSSPPSFPKLTITESLSIAEYLAESYPSLPFWPSDPYLRALARSAVSEMHAGFSEVRNTFATNFTGLYTGPVPINDKQKKEIERLLTVFGASRKETVKRLKALGKEDEDDGFMFGNFGIADSYYWPVLWRFRTYNFPLDSASPEALAWMKGMWEDSRLKKEGESYWKQVEDPESLIHKYENIFKEIPEVVYGRVSKDWQFGG